MTRLYEFFSGIGGMRLGVQERLELTSVTAIECAPACNAVHKINFPGDTIRVKMVQQLSPASIDGKADVWTLSPPCQPYTTTANARQRDDEDPRAEGFLALCDILSQLSEPPRHIMLENVKGFVGSKSLAKWKAALRGQGFTWRQYLMSPVDLGIPNNRTRYYMIAERSDRFALDVAREEGLGEAPVVWSELPANRRSPHRAYDGGANDGAGANDGDGAEAKEGQGRARISPLAPYLEDEPAEGKEALLVKDKVLAKGFSTGLSILGALDRTTFCFTKNYGKVMNKSSGSLLYLDSVGGAPIRQSLATDPIDKSAGNMLGHAGRIRHFSPRELLNLFGFPASFVLPADLTLKKKFDCIGNSVNVKAVSALAAELFEGGKERVSAKAYALLEKELRRRETARLLVHEIRCFGREQAAAAAAAAGDEGATEKNPAAAAIDALRRLKEEDPQYYETFASINKQLVSKIAAEAAAPPVALTAPAVDVRPLALAAAGGALVSAVAMGALVWLKKKQ